MLGLVKEHQVPCAITLPFVEGSFDSISVGTMPQYPWRIGCMPSLRMDSWFSLASSVLSTNQLSWTGPPYPDIFAM